MDFVPVVVVVLLILAIPISAFVRLIAAMFSSEVRSRIRQHPILHIIYVTAAVLVLVLAFGLLRPYPDPSSRFRRARRVTRSLVEAMKAYYTEYGHWPLQSSTNEDHTYQSDYKQFTESLSGKNPRRLVFYDFVPKDFDKEGQYLDPWKHPFNVMADWSGDSEITIGTNRVHTGVIIWSDGSNGINESGDGDDIASWK